MRHHLLRAGPLGSQPWSPFEIPTLLWFDAATPSTITSTSGSVQSFKDKKSPLTLERFTAGGADIITGAISQGGLNVLDLTGIGATDIAYLRNPSSPVAAASGNVTFATVARVSGAPPFGSLYSVDSNNDFQLDASAEGVFAPRILSTSLGLPSIESDLGNQLGAWGIFVVRFDFSTNTAEIRVNGSVGASSASYTIKLTGTQAFSLFTNRGTDKHLRGQFAEHVITDDDAVVSTAERLEGYLAHRWGLAASLPVDHPYKNSPPTI